MGKDDNGDGAFAHELVRRSPLARAVLEASDFVMDDAMLGAVYEANRGRCYEDVLKFPDFLRLLREVLVRHDGSGHRLYLELEERDEEPVDESNFYRKLARTPVDVSRALLRTAAARVGELMPQGSQSPLPYCFDGFRVLAADGKKVKNAAKRLKPTRGYSGKLLGAKALVAMDVRSGLAVAMSDSLDGEANDVPLVPALMSQLRELSEGGVPLLTVWDRQFDGVSTLRLLSARAGDAYVVRLRDDTRVRFEPDGPPRMTTDAQGPTVSDEVGTLGSGKSALRVRRVTLDRKGKGEEDVRLVTNLLDDAAVPAEALLALYKRRWGIEQLFQQVTETFGLARLMGSGPKAVLLQLSVCLLLYDLVQMVKAYVAADGRVLAATVSTFYLFLNVKKELTAWAYHAPDAAWPRPAGRDAEMMRVRLGELLRGSWKRSYTKASDKRPRTKPPPTHRIHGGHTSVQRLLDGTARLIKL
jgi:hypothetical protein